MNDPNNLDHAWIHEHLGAAVTGGLTPEEQARFDAHINACPACFDAFTDARDADRTLQRNLAGLAPSGGGNDFEETLITLVREKTMHKRFNPIVKRAGMAIAAAVALAATGLFANVIVHQGPFNNPLTQNLTADADKVLPPLQDFLPTLSKARELANRKPIDKVDEKSAINLAFASEPFTSDQSGQQGQEASGRSGADELSKTGDKMASLPLIRYRFGVRVLDTDAKSSVNHNEWTEHEKLARGTSELKSVRDVLVVPDTNIKPPSFDLAGVTKNGSTGGGSGGGGSGPADRDALGRNVMTNSGSGTLALGGANTYSGGTTTSGGTLTMNRGGTTLAGTITHGPSSTPVIVSAGVDGTYGKTVDLNGGTVTGTGGGNLTISGGLAHVDAVRLRDTQNQLFSDAKITPTGGTATAGQNVYGWVEGGYTYDHRNAGKLDINYFKPTAVAAMPWGSADHGKAQTVAMGDIKAGDGIDKAAGRKIASAEKRSEVENRLDLQKSLNDATKADKGTLAVPTGTGVPGSVATFISPQYALANTNAPAAATPPAPTAASEVAQIKVIRNGQVDFEVRSFDDAYLTISAVTTEEGGYVSSTSSEKLANGKIRGTVVVRVPPEHLDRMLLKLRSLGDLKGQQISAQDVTKQYTDVESELRGLRAMEGRLIDLIKNGKGTVKDLVEAEKQLGEYRVRIEKLEGEIRYYNNLVGMATLNITVFEKDIQTPTAASEQENVTLSVETEDVETKYHDARKILDDAKGRIVESELKKYDADQFSARIVVDVPPDKADFVAAQLKQIGKVATYNRDRKQTTTGGTGVPTVQVEQKDTRFTISLYNLANIAPRETAILTVAVTDVEPVFRKVLNLVQQVNDKDAKPAGRVVTSNINGGGGPQVEQMTADIRADVRADQADAILEAIRATGEVLASTTTQNPDTANVTASKRGIQLRLINLATVAPRETAVLNIAVRDVDADYRKILGLIRQVPDDHKLSDQQPRAVGRVISSNINGQQPEQMSADIRADIRADQADAILQAIRDSGEVLTSTSAQIPDGATFTAAKRGLQLHMVNAAAIPARESQTLHLVAANVADAYKQLLRSLQPQVDAGNVRITTSQLNESDPRTVAAALSFDARREALPAVDKAFSDAGIDIISNNVVRSADTVNTLDSKVHYQVMELIAAAALPPRSTTVLGIEIDNVEKSLNGLRATLPPNAKELDYSLSKESNGRITGHLVVDVPVSDAMNMLTRIKDINGTEKVNQVVKNNQVPETRFARERFELTLVSKEGIVESGKGLGATVGSALKSATAGLLWSVYLIVAGVLFMGPWLLIGWGSWKLVRRKKAA